MNAHCANFTRIRRFKPYPAKLDLSLPQADFPNHRPVSLNTLLSLPDPKTVKGKGHFKNWQKVILDFTVSVMSRLIFTISGRPS